MSLKGQMSEIELHFPMGRLHGAKLAAAQRGELRHSLPVGLIYDSDGDVVKDPDEQIQAAVADLFAEHTSEQLAERLNAAGLLTGKGKPFTAGGVARVRDADKIWAPRTVAIQDGEVSESPPTPSTTAADLPEQGRQVVPAQVGPARGQRLPWAVRCSP
ncbi:MAG TPA: hypothetical protein VJ777_01545 [Mycobacterium sp.]|nr:hypothetical protein [Mycobacterium sp.]